MWECSNRLILNYIHWENGGLLYHSHCLHTVLEQSGIKLMSSREGNLSFSWVQNCIHNSKRTSYNLKHMANKPWHIAESNLTEQATFTFLMKVTITPGVDVILWFRGPISIILGHPAAFPKALCKLCNTVYLEVFFQIGLKLNTDQCYFYFCLQVIYSYRLMEEKNNLWEYTTVKPKFTLRGSGQGVDDIFGLWVNAFFHIMKIL